MVVSFRYAADDDVTKSSAGTELTPYSECPTEGSASVASHQSPTQATGALRFPSGRHGGGRVSQSATRATSRLVLYPPVEMPPHPEPQGQHPHGQHPLRPSVQPEPFSGQGRSRRAPQRPPQQFVEHCRDQSRDLEGYGQRFSQGSSQSFGQGFSQGMRPHNAPSPPQPQPMHYPTPQYRTSHQSAQQQLHVPYAPPYAPQNAPAPQPALQRPSSIEQTGGHTGGQMNADMMSGGDDASNYRGDENNGDHPGDFTANCNGSSSSSSSSASSNKKLKLSTRPADSALLAAASEGNVRAVRKLLLGSGAAGGGCHSGVEAAAVDAVVRPRGSGGKAGRPTTALMAACRAHASGEATAEGSLACVAALLEAGADPNLDLGWLRATTPLHEASTAAIARLLLAAGARSSASGNPREPPPEWYHAHRGRPDVASTIREFRARHGLSTGLASEDDRGPREGSRGGGGSSGRNSKSSRGGGDRSGERGHGSEPSSRGSVTGSLELLSLAAVSLDDLVTSGSLKGRSRDDPSGGGGGGGGGGGDDDDDSGGGGGDH